MKPAKEHCKIYLEPSAKPGVYEFAICPDTDPSKVTRVRLTFTPGNVFAIAISKPAESGEPQAEDAVIRGVAGEELRDLFWLMAARGGMEQYTHHPQYGPVWVDKGQKGLHRKFCLCHRCESFKPNKPENCPIAEALFQVCKAHGLVTPVWECPKFRKEG